MTVGKILLLVLVAAALAACQDASLSSNMITGGGYTGGSTADVAISGLKYRPATLMFPAGVTTTWTNTDSVSHTVTDSSASPTFDSLNIAPGDTYVFTFTTPGTFPYHCSIHPGMTGTITVTP
jgi:plastocyanin